MSYGGSLQWTEVRYGRRGRLLRDGGGLAGARDQRRTDSRGMDRAFPVGWRRGPGVVDCIDPTPDSRLFTGEVDCRGQLRFIVCSTNLFPGELQSQKPVRQRDSAIIADLLAILRRASPVDAGPQLGILAVLRRASPIDAGLLLSRVAEAVRQRDSAIIADLLAILRRASPVDAGPQLGILAVLRRASPIDAGLLLSRGAVT
ncbi:hypothetical protein Q5P01_000363 [Channa striata]|uniref:Uncharacterized protein n=1 Tax=Channa striata TaxID=64152 RepID=A0AA88LMG1_CHASR|nr:hypothetical protein Q5P01_000363 [Channa striata]